MKIRLGALTGTPLDGAGVYFSLDGTRQGMVGLASVQFGVRSGPRGQGGKVVQLWPGAGQHRVAALRLSLSDALSDQLNRYRLATQDFSLGGGFLRLVKGSRVWRRDGVKADISWDPVSQSVVFHRNQGPFADTLMRGDFVELEVGMNGWTDVIGVSVSLGELTLMRTFQPVSTCDVSVVGRWYGHAVPGAAGVMEGDEWVTHVQAYSKKKRKGGRKYYDSGATVKGMEGGPYTAWLYGEPGCAEVRVTYPAASLGMSAKILDIIVQG